MKKIISILTALALLFALGACKRGHAETSDTTPPDTSVTAPTAPVTTASSETATDTSAVPPYDTVRRTVSSSALDCAYDILTLRDEKTDAALAATADEAFATYVPNVSSLEAEGGSATYTADLAEIYVDAKWISASFTGSYTVTGADGREARGDVYYTVNVDRESGKLLSGGDIVTDFDALAKALADGKFTPGAPDADALAQYRPEYDIYPYFRADGTHFYVGISVPGVTEVCTEYAIPRADAADFLAPAYR